MLSNPGQEVVIEILPVRFGVPTLKLADDVDHYSRDPLIPPRLDDFTNRFQWPGVVNPACDLFLEDLHNRVELEQRPQNHEQGNSLPRIGFNPNFLIDVFTVELLEDTN